MWDFGMIANVNRIIREGAENRLSEREFMQREIRRFLVSPERRMMVAGDNYYRGNQDIDRKRRETIGPDGQLQEVKNLPNNRLEDNQYRKMVIQKVNYLVGKPISFRSDNEEYADKLNAVFNKAWDRQLKTIAKDALNCGICWVHPTYSDEGSLRFYIFPGYEICPGWADADHTVLEYAYRVYPIRFEDKNNEKRIWKVELYTESGIDYFETDDTASNLVPCDPWHQNYLMLADENGNEDGYNWSRIPLIPFRYNEDETPLIKCVKSLQDAINTILSNFSDNMQEDVRNTVLVLVGYDGENLGEFRRNLATYGVIQVTSIDGAPGDVKTLQISVNSENYKTVLELLKKAIIENCMGYDAKDDRLSGTPNQMNIMSMYNDIDLDANNMETEFQASMEQLLWFVDTHLANIGEGDFSGEHVDVIFDRDMMMNEADVITNIRNSEGLLSTETLISQHPWVTDPAAELERLEKEKQENMEQYGFFGAGGDSAAAQDTDTQDVNDVPEEADAEKK